MNIHHRQFVGQEGGIPGNGKMSYWTLSFKESLEMTIQINLDIFSNFLFEIKIIQVNEAHI